MRSNIKNFRPKREAADLLMVLDQIAHWRAVDAMNIKMAGWLAAWRAKHGEQTQAQKPVAPPQDPQRHPSGHPARGR